MKIFSSFSLVEKNKTKFDLYWKLFVRPKRIIASFFTYSIFRQKNASLIQRWTKRHRNELMLLDFEVVRLLGWTDQYDEDYYYILDHIGRKKKEVFLYSCVGQPTTMKTKLRVFDYLHLQHIWDLNDMSVEKGLERAKKKKIIVK